MAFRPVSYHKSDNTAPGSPAQQGKQHPTGMIVDDRLDTVLCTEVAGPMGRNTQLRQLVDILGAASDGDQPAAPDAVRRAFDRLAALHDDLGDDATGVLVGLCRVRSARLVAHLAGLGPRTGLAAIARAQLNDREWLALIPGLPVQARGGLRHRRDLGAPVIALLKRLGIDDFALPGPDPATPDPTCPEGQAAAPLQAEVVQAESQPFSNVLVPLPTDAPRRSDGGSRQGIGAIVRRIEAFRRTRNGEDRTEAQAALPFAEDGTPDPLATAIDLAIDSAGVICAADGADPAALVGHRPFALPGPAAAASVDPATLAAFRARRPIVAGALALDGAPAIAGAWRIDAVPLFGSDGGQFTGYRARLRRPPQRTADQDGDAAPAGAVMSGADALHQLLHELRTPINAIQGFAELIQQQMLGPTPHQYRGIAASIAADAARMLAGFEDVERLVRLETGRVRIEPGEVDLGAVLTRLISQIEPLISPREIRLRWTVPAEPVPVGMAPEEAERTLWRLLSTLVGAAAPGERMALSLDFASLDPTGAGRSARLVATLPSALALRDDTALFAPDIVRGSSVPGMGMLGHGFALRLCAAELRAAGGLLERPGTASSPVLGMTLPLAAPVMLDRATIAS
jgi:two-component system, OmpR family, sensor kinase